MCKNNNSISQKCHSLFHHLSNFRKLLAVCWVLLGTVSNENIWVSNRSPIDLLFISIIILKGNACFVIWGFTWCCQTKTEEKHKVHFGTSQDISILTASAPYFLHRWHIVHWNKRAICSILHVLQVTFLIINIFPLTTIYIS